jgi:ABC-type Fe3+ transport system permease subunit
MDWIPDSHLIEVTTRSLIIMLSVVILSIGVGLPLGTLAGLYDFWGKRVLLGILALPLLMPSFLWAIGLSQFQILFNISEFTHVAGALGSIFVFSTLLIPLAIYAAMLAVKSISQHQIDALIMVGSARWSFAQVIKRTAPITVLISLLAGIMTLSDPGPGMILGYSGIAAEILVSFSALFDFDLARQQCFFIATLSLVLAFPLIFFLSKPLTTALLAQETSTIQVYKNAQVQRFAPPIFIALLFVIIGVPLIGLFKPLLQELDLIYALKTLQRTGGNTLFYSTIAGIFSTLLALLLVLLTAQYKQGKVILIMCSLLFLVLPSSFVALNVIEWSTSVSAVWDWLFRGKFLVGAVLAFRFFPIATLLIIKRYTTISPSWFDTAKQSGVPKIKFYSQVIIPFLTPALALSVLIVTLLATAEISTVLLLRPPGEDSFPLAIFTVMANASEVKVASLCFVYFVISAFSLILLWTVLGRKEK